MILRNRNSFSYLIRSRNGRTTQTSKLLERLLSLTSHWKNWGPEYLPCICTWQSSFVYFRSFWSWIYPLWRPITTLGIFMVKMRDIWFSLLSEMLVFLRLSVFNLRPGKRKSSFVNRDKFQGLLTGVSKSILRSKINV